jgi:uncharacterized membrane protein YdjX (TVP38/TMEM64 family)
MDPGASETNETTVAETASASVEPVKVEIVPSRVPPKPMWPRLVLLVAVLGAIFLVGHLTGATEYLTRARIRELMEDLGVWGFLLFLVLFAIGELVHIPGIVFVLAALLAYGRVLGAAAGYVGGLLSVSVAFLVVRKVGGQLLTEVKRPLMRRVVDRLERRPISTIAALRAVLWFAPIVNVVLAMSSVRFRDYLLGSAIGFLVPIAILTIAFEWALAFFE